MEPQVSIGTFHQASWPGAGDVDDCWAVADLQAIHATAPWLRLATIPIYRAAAGNPDMPGPTGGSIGDSRRAIRMLYPKLDVVVLDADLGESFAGFLARVKGGRVASVAVLASALPASLQYGFGGRHRVTIYWDGAKLRILNPLQQAHKRADDISADSLKAAIVAYGSGVRAIVMPTPAEAFAFHPLLPAAVEAATVKLTADLAGAADRLASIAKIATG